MTYFYITMVVLGVMDMKELRNAGHRKDITVYIGSMLFVGIFAYFYFSDPYGRSFTKLLLSLFNLKG